jgi:hypothetical protein
MKRAALRRRFSSAMRLQSMIGQHRAEYSELGFPVRHEGGQLMISTGEITDGFSKAFGDLVSLYSSYQVGWSSQVLNVFTAKYAKIDRTIEHRVRELARALHPVEEEFRLFLNGVVTGGKGAFGMKAFKRNKK